MGNGLISPEPSSVREMNQWAGHRVAGPPSVTRRYRVISTAKNGSNTGHGSADSRGCPSASGRHGCPSGSGRHGCPSASAAPSRPGSSRRRVADGRAVDRGSRHAGAADEPDAGGNQHRQQDSTHFEVSSPRLVRDRTGPMGDPVPSHSPLAGAFGSGSSRRESASQATASFSSAYSLRSTAVRSRLACMCKITVITYGSWPTRSSLVHGGGAQ